MADQVLKRGTHRQRPDQETVWSNPHRRQPPGSQHQVLAIGVPCPSISSPPSVGRFLHLLYWTMIISAHQGDRSTPASTAWVTQAHPLPQRTFGPQGFQVQEMMEETPQDGPRLPGIQLGNRIVMDPKGCSPGINMPEPSQTSPSSPNLSQLLLGDNSNRFQ